MELTELIQHPEMMDKETLYDLRSLIALHPYYQTARILMLQNLYLLHDPTFDEELRRAAIYITDRSVLFNMFEGPHYQLDKVEEGKQDDEKKDKGAESRTISLIDDFLKSIPNTDEDGPAKKRKPTPADAAIDYVSYLVDIESPEEQETEKEVQLKGQNLIDNFIKNDKGYILDERMSYDYTILGASENVVAVCRTPYGKDAKTYGTLAIEGDALIFVEKEETGANVSSKDG